MDIIMLFLAKALDKHGITLVHIIYPPLESMIKPILMFSSEIWGHQMKPNDDSELSFVKFCEHILGVDRRSANKTVMSKLGVYPFQIDAKLNIISFYLYLKGSKGCLCGGEPALLEG